MTEGNLEIKERNQVAFFPGTFDPFTLSHKEIVREIRDRGYEVFLAIDEFSWSKKAQPHLIRRQIVSMSVADEFQMCIRDRVQLELPLESKIAPRGECTYGKKTFRITAYDN